MAERLCVARIDRKRAVVHRERFPGSIQGLEHDAQVGAGRRRAWIDKQGLADQARCFLVASLLPADQSEEMQRIEITVIESQDGSVLPVCMRQLPALMRRYSLTQGFRDADRWFHGLAGNAQTLCNEIRVRPMARLSQFRPYARDHAVPVLKRWLAEQARSPIPGAVRAVQHPPPVGRKW